VTGSIASLEDIGLNSDGEGEGEGEEYFDAYDSLSMRSFERAVSEQGGELDEGAGSEEGLGSFEEHVLIVVHSHCILGPSEIDDPGDDIRTLQRTLSQITSTRHWHIIPVFHAGVTDEATALMEKLHVRQHPSACPLDAIALASFGGKRYLDHLRACMRDVNDAFLKFRREHPGGKRISGVRVWGPAPVLHVLLWQCPRLRPCICIAV